MINNLKVLALIPARGGSKGIKDKNIYDINGKPLIAYSIIAAQNSKYVDDVVFDASYQNKKHHRYETNYHHDNRVRGLPADGIGSEHHREYP